MKLKKIFFGILFFIWILFSTIGIRNTMMEQDAHYTPTYAKKDLKSVLSKKTLTDKDYSLLFRQTGLGKPAVDELRDSKNNSESLRNIFQTYQDDFFRSISYESGQNYYTTNRQSIVDENGNTTNGFQLAPYHNGYILLTSASFTSGIRNGHTGLVVDEKNGLSLEAVSIGKNSRICDVDSWRSSANFIMYRLLDSSQEELDAIAENALSCLLNKPYSLTVGLFSKKRCNRNAITGTHCAHLVWEAFSFYGYDLDSNGGMIVSVKDISKSKELEVVQVYGFPTDKLWE